MKKKSYNIKQLQTISLTLIIRRNKHLKYMIVHILHLNEQFNNTQIYPLIYGHVLARYKLI